MAHLCVSPVPTMNEATKEAGQTEKIWKSVDMEAALVPVLALLIQTGYAAAREGRILLLSLFVHPLTLPVMLLVVIMAGLISYFVLHPFRRDHSARAFVFLVTVAAFAGAACFFTGSPVVK